MTEAPAPSKTMARWALGLAFVPGGIPWILSITFAIIVRKKSKDGLDHGKRMATGAFIVIAVWIIAIIAIIAVRVAGDETTESAAPGTQKGTVTTDSVRVGDCLADDIATITTTVDIVPCSERHSAEVYAQFALPAGRYPGTAEVSKRSDAGCSSRFATFVGTSYTTSGLTLRFLQPSKASWPLDQLVTCFVQDDKPVSGSLRNAQR